MNARQPHRADIAPLHCVVGSGNTWDRRDVWGGMTERKRRAMLKKNPEVVSSSALFDELQTRNVSLK
jgi:hypothetical protein